MKTPHQPPQSKYLDGLVNPRAYHRPPKQPRRRFRFALNRMQAITTLCVVAIIFAAIPTVRSFTRQYEVFELLTNGRYLVLFQNDAEIRPSGGFIGSFAIVESNNGVIKPLYFETNIYKLDTPFAGLQYIDPPKPLKTAILDKGWAMRDSNFATDFRQAAPTVAWFFEQEASKATGTKRGELNAALGNNFKVDGVISITMSAFLDVLKETGPIAVPGHNTTVDDKNFFTIVQQVVEKDYFTDPKNKETNEPKTILKDLFPAAMSRTQNLRKKQLYDLSMKLLREKKVVLYANDPQKEQVLVDQGWAGATELAADMRPDGKSDFLAIVRSSHGGNKSSVDINPIYKYYVDSKAGDTLNVKLEITFEHTGTGAWPSGVNHEYLRVLAPTEAVLGRALRNGQEATAEVDIGTEMGKAAFGFWLHTQPSSSQTFVLNYAMPRTAVDKDYQLTLFRQPGSNNPDLTAIYDNEILYQGRLSGDKVIRAK